MCVLMSSTLSGSSEIRSDNRCRVLTIVASLADRHVEIESRHGRDFILVVASCVWRHPGVWGEVQVRDVGPLRFEPLEQQLVLGEVGVLFILRQKRGRES